jgi:hypothetical protein
VKMKEWDKNRFSVLFPSLNLWTGAFMKDIAESFLAELLVT